jgi:hypothetical protein
MYNILRVSITENACSTVQQTVSELVIFAQHPYDWSVPSQEETRNSYNILAEDLSRNTASAKLRSLLGTRLL